MPSRPPLNSLHIFCVAVREGGFRQAAQALCVTPGAISRQIQQLEERVGYPLFERGAGINCLPTPAGRQLYGRVADKLAAVVEAVEGNTHPRTTHVLVDTSVTLAMHWLIPQLRGFSERHPHIQVQVRTADGDIDPSTSAQVFIRRDPSELRGLPHEDFMLEHSVMVASPALLPSRRQGANARRRWIEGMPRIGAKSRPDLWNRWDAFSGSSGLRLEPTLFFDNTVLAIQAAAQGLGICIVPEIFVKSFLDSQTLHPVFPDRITTGSYSVAVGRGKESLRVRTFIDWMREVSHLASSGVASAR